MARSKNSKNKKSRDKSDNKKPAKDKIEMSGVVIAALGGDKFMVQLEGSQQVMAYMAGKMRKFYIRIVPGDVVTVELSPYDLTKGRITYRER